MSILGKAKQLTVRKAFIQSRLRSKKYTEDEMAEMERFVLSDECVNDLIRLENGDFFPDYPTYRLVAKNFNSKKRAVYSFDGDQGILFKLIVFAMRDLESIFSDRLFSFRSDKTAKDLLFEVCELRGLKDMYILKTDVSNYVGSIVPGLLIPQLEEIFMPDDPEFFKFLEWLLTRNKVIDHQGRVIDHCPGGMGGVPFGNFFMNLYLHEMDEYYAPRAPFYSRYSDDILICAKTSDKIREFESIYYEFLDHLQLSTNKEKTMILNPGEAFDLLGMRIANGRITISEHSMKKILRKLRRFTNQALISRNTGKMSAEEAARNLIIRFNRFFFGSDGNEKLLSWARWSFPVISGTEEIRKIDHYFQNSLRYVLYGSMKKRNLSIPYEKLSALGYRSLVYYYHHQDQIQYIEREYTSL
jgi:hypothetical protein